MTDVPTAACASCGATRLGPWCHACGQACRDAPRSFREVFTGQTGLTITAVVAAILTA